MAHSCILGSSKFLVDIGATADIDRAKERNCSLRLRPDADIGRTLNDQA